MGDKTREGSTSNSSINLGLHLDEEQHLAGSSEGGADGGAGVIKEQDRLLPIANVGRLMKQILPPNAKVSKEAKETMQECASEFISFVTGEASDRCHKEKRKTVNGDDVCWALGTLGFDDYVEPLRRYLHRYREVEGERATHNRASQAQNRDHHSQPSGSSSFTFDVVERNEGSNAKPY